MRAIKVLPDGQCSVVNLQGGYTMTTHFLESVKSNLQEPASLSYVFARGYDFWGGDSGNWNANSPEHHNPLIERITGLAFYGPCVIVKHQEGQFAATMATTLYVDICSENQGDLAGYVRELAEPTGFITPPNEEAESQKEAPGAPKKPCRRPVII